MKFILRASLALLVPLAASAQKSTLIGKVGAMPDGSPLAFANIRLDGSMSGTYSNTEGHFSLGGLRAGRYPITISLIGYRTVHDTIAIRSDETTTYNVLLWSDTALVDEVQIVSTRVTDRSAMAYTNVSKEDIAEKNFGQDVPYLLNTLPSVVVTSDAGTGVGYTGIRIRGSDNTRINASINGVPVNDAESQGTFWVDLPDIISSVDNIQVQRGVGGSTNGAGAFGGSLNLQTLKMNATPYGEVLSGYGSFNTLRNTVNAGSGLINDHWTFDTRLSKITSDGYIDRARADLKSYFLQGAYYGKRTIVKAIVFSGMEETYQAWNGVPEDSLKTNRTYNELGLHTDPVTGKIVAYDNQVDHYRQDYAQLLFSYQLNKNLYLNAALHNTRGIGYYEEFREGDDLSSYGIGPIYLNSDTITTADLIRRKWLDNDFYGATFSLNYNNNEKIQASLGGGWNEYDGGHYGHVIWSQFAGNSTPTTRYYNDDATKKDFNVYGKINYAVTKKLNVFADLQLRMIDYSFRGYDANFNNVTQDAKLTFFNPKAGLSFDINDANNVYASFAVGNKEPNRDDYTGSTPASRPKPETLYDTEAGWRLRRGKYSAGANVYYMLYSNQLVLTGQVNDVGSYTRMNVADSYRAGIELEFAWNFTKQLTLMANTTLSQNKIKSFVAYYDDYDNGGQLDTTYKNTDIAFSPAAIAAAQLRYAPVKFFTATLTAKYVGQQFLDNTQTESRSIDPYFTTDLRLAFAFHPKHMRELGLGIQLNNLLNTLYVSNGYTYGYYSGGMYTHVNYYYPQAGLNVMTMLSLRF